MRAIIFTLIILFPLTLMSQTYVGKRITTVLYDNPDTRYAVNDGIYTSIGDDYIYLFKSATPNDSIYSDGYIQMDNESGIIIKQVYSINRLCLKEIMLQIHNLELQGIKYTKIDDDKYTYITAFIKTK